MNNHKNFGGNTMSLNKSATHRLSLLAGSSLVAASLSFTVVTAPTTAAAQAVCAPAPSSTSNGGNTVIYSGTAYATGIDCDSGGDMTVAVTTNSVDIGGPGIALTGTGTNSVIFNGPNASSSQEIDGVGLTGALLSITTGGGDITVNAGALDADQSNAAAMTHGLLATSTSGDIDVTLIGSVDADASGANTGGQAGVWAQTGGVGSIDLTTTGVEGRLYGIYAEVAGSGDLTINSSFVGVNATAGIAGIRAVSAGSGAVTISGNASTSAASSAAFSATTGTGLLTITGSAVARQGTAYLVNAGGDLVINNTGQSGGVTWGADIAGAAGRMVTINNTGAGRLYGGNTNSSNTVSGNAIRVQGAGALRIDNAGIIGGLFDLSAMTGAADINILDGGLWHHAYNNSILTSAADMLDIADGGFLAISVREGEAHSATTGAAVIDFGAGVDAVTNAGGVMVGHELRLVNLEAFHHTGLIVLGYEIDSSDEILTNGTDARINDIFAMPGAHFFGEGGQIMLDVFLGGAAQSSCSPSLRDTNSDLPTADCLDLTGGVTEGVTPILINDIFPNDRGADLSAGAVLVDVAGGTSAQGHFVIDPASDFYSTEFGGVIDKGYFIYALGYDADTQQHRIYGVPGASPLQAPLLAQSAHGLWRLSTGTWFDRQADLRGDEGIGGGWLRISGETADRDVLQSQDIGSTALTLDNSFSQKSYAVSGGADLMRGGGEGRSYVLGVMAGYANSEVEFDISPNAAQFDGWTGGAYASFLSGGLFVDAAINANRLILKYDVPALDLFPSGTILDTDLISLGAQLEAGWRFAVGGAGFVEPLAAVSYVRTQYDDMEIAAQDPARGGLSVEFDDPASLRAGLGARVGLDQDYGGYRTQFSLLGRVWNEYEDEARAILHNPGEDALLLSESAGALSEFGVGASIYDSGDAVSGFVHFGGKFGDDYNSQNLAAGVRVAW
jgi:hypothetical protein